MSNCTPKWPVASFLCHTVRSDQKIKEKKTKKEQKIDKQSEKNSLRVGESNPVDSMSLWMSRYLCNITTM